MTPPASQTRPPPLTLRRGCEIPPPRLDVIGEERLSLSEMGDLEYAFEASRLPYRVDLVDWAITKDYFRKIIEAHHEVVQVDETTETLLV